MFGIINEIVSGIKDRQSQNYGKELNVQSDMIRRNIDASNQRQAEIEMQKAAAAGARSDIGLDQWNTVLGSGTKDNDYIQAYMQGQKGRDFQNPNALSPQNILFAVIAMVGFFVLVMVIMLSKSKSQATVALENNKK